MNKTFLSIVVLAAACGGKGGEPPPKPHTGAPMAFEVKKLTPGKHFDGKVDVRVYNFADKPIAHYSVRMRFYDASGKWIRSNPDSPFEYDSMSFQAKEYVCDPKSWCEFAFDADVPEGATKATVLADRLTAVKDDGMTMEDKALYDLDGMDWPEPPGTAAAKPVAK